MRKFKAYVNGDEVHLHEQGDFYMWEIPPIISVPILKDGDNRDYFTYGGKYFYMDSDNWSNI